MCFLARVCNVTRDLEAVLSDVVLGRAILVMSERGGYFKVNVLGDEKEESWARVEYFLVGCVHDVKELETSQPNQGEEQGMRLLKLLRLHLGDLLLNFRS